MCAETVARDGERGSAMLLTVAASVLMLALGSALVLITTTETRIAARFARSTETLHAAEAVLDRALLDLFALPDWDLALNGAARSVFADGAPAGTRTIGAVSIDLAQLTNELRCGRATCAPADMSVVTPERPWGSNNPRWQLFAWGRLSGLAPVSPDRDVYVLVWVADDPAETDGDPLRDGTTADNPGRGMIGAIAHAYGAGGLRRRLEVTFSRRAGARNGNFLTGGGPPSPGPARIVAWREVR